MSEGLLFKSKSYEVSYSQETVFLAGGGTPTGLEIGDFYGNPNEAVIDAEEQWCLMVGCGLIVYSLGPPWARYHYDNAPHNYDINREQQCVQSEDREWGAFAAHMDGQWWEYGREPPEPLWLASVVHVEGERFEVRALSGTGPNQPEGYVVLARSQVVGPIT